VKSGPRTRVQMEGRVDHRVDRSMDAQLVLVRLCQDTEGMHQSRYLNWVDAEQ
jgi:hypothetical protein